MADVKLGSAVFDFVLNSAEFVKGMSESAGSITDLASKATSGFSKSSKAAQEFGKKSSDLDRTLANQGAKVSRLTVDLQKLRQSINQTRDAYDAQAKKVDYINQVVIRQKARILDITNQYGAFRTKAEAAYRAIGMSAQQAAQMAENAYQKGLSREQQILAGIVSQRAKNIASLDTLKKSYKDSLAQLDKLGPGIKEAIQRETEEFNRIQANRNKLGTGPTSPGRLASAVGRISEPARNLTASLESTSERVGSLARTFDRLTRGVRGSSAEMNRARESVYAAEQAAKSHAAAVQKQEQVVKSYASDFLAAEAQKLKRITQINEVLAKQGVMQARIAAEQQKLSSMQPGPYYDIQKKKIEDLVAELKDLEAAHKQQLAYQKQDEDRLAELNEKRNVSIALLNKLKDSTKSFSDRVDDAKTRLSLLIAKEKDKAEKTKESTRTQKDQTKATENQSRAIQGQGAKTSWLSGVLNIFINRTNSTTQVLQKQSASMQAASKSAIDLNTSLNKVNIQGAAFVGTFAGNIFGNFISGLQGAGANALQLYKSDELLLLSLKNLYKVQMQREGQIKGMNEGDEIAIGKAKELYAWMGKLALASPFTTEQLKGSFQLGMSFGFSAEQMQRLTNATVNWASANGRSAYDVEAVTRALGQMNANQRVTLEDLGQLTNVGMDWTAVLTKEFGPEIAKSGKSLRELISAGIVPADRAIAALTETMERDFPTGAADAGASMTGLLASLEDIRDIGFKSAFSGLFEAIKPLLTMLTDYLVNSDILDRIKEFGNTIGTSIGGVVNNLQNIIPQFLAAWNEFGPAIMEGFSILGDIAGMAYEWGANIVSQFADGMSAYLGGIFDIISEIGSLLTYWLAPGSPPKVVPEIDEWGRGTMLAWGDGMTQGVKEVVTSVSSRVRGMLTTMLAMRGDDSKESQLGVLGKVMGTQDAIRSVMTEYERTGRVAERTFAMVRSAAGEAGAQIEQYMRHMIGVRQATERTRQAQEALNAITAAYDARLKPLQDRLNAMREAQMRSERQKEIANLTEMLNFQNPNGMETDMSGVRARLEELQIEEEIAAIEAERSGATSAAEEELQRAITEQELREKQLETLEAQMDFQAQQNELMAEQVALLRQIAEEREKEADQDDKSLTDSERLIKQQEEEAKRIADAEFEARFAAASTEEQIQMLQQRMAEAGEGTLEYAQAKKRLIQTEEKYRKELAAANEEQFEAALANATTEEKMHLIEERLANLTPGTKEYAEMQQKLTRAQEAYQKELDAGEKAIKKLSDAEFEANLAGMDRQEQIVALRDRLAGLTEGTVEYEKVRKRLNSLERQEAAAGGAGGGGAGKGAMLGGRPFEGLQKSAESALQPVKDLHDRVGQVTKRFDGAREAATGIFNKLKEYTPVVSFLLQRLATGIGLTLVVERVVKPLWAFTVGLRGLLSITNILSFAIIGLGYAFKENIGGIREIASSTFDAIKPMFERIGETINTIAKAFQEGGIKEGFQSLVRNMPSILGDLRNVFERIGQGIMEWIGPFLAQAIPVASSFLSDIVSNIRNWVQSGGIERLFESLKSLFEQGWEAISGFFSTIGEDAMEGDVGGIVNYIGGLLQKSIAPIQEKAKEWGLLALGAIGGALSVGGEFITDTLLPALIGGVGLLLIELGKFLIDKWPEIVQWFQDLGDKIAKWFENEFPVLMEVLGIALGAGIPALFMRILNQALPTLFPAFLQLINRIASLIPHLIRMVTNFVISFVAWLASDGMVEITRTFGIVLTSILDWFATTAPTLGYQIGKLIGETVTKIGLAILAIGLYFIKNGPQIMTDLSNWLTNDLLPGLTSAIDAVFATLAAIFFGLFEGLFDPIIDVIRLGVDSTIKSMFEGLGISLTDGWPAWVGRMVEMWDDAIRTIKNFLGIHSPSTVAYDIVANLISGFVAGLDATWEAFAENILTKFTAIKDTISNSFTTAQTNAIAATNTLSSEVMKITDPFVKDLTKAWVNLEDSADKNWKKIENWVKDYSNNAYRGATSSFSSLEGEVTAKITTLRDNIAIWWQNIYTSITTKSNEALTEVRTAFEGIQDKVETAIDAIKKLLQETNLAEAAKNMAVGFVTSLIQQFQTEGSRLARAVADFVKTAIDEAISNFFDNFKPPSSSSSGSSSGSGGGSSGGGGSGSGSGGSSGGKSFGTSSTEKNSGYGKGAAKTAAAVIGGPATNVNWNTGQKYTGVKNSGLFFDVLQMLDRLSGGATPESSVFSGLAGRVRSISPQLARSLLPIEMNGLNRWMQWAHYNVDEQLAAPGPEKFGKLKTMILDTMNALGLNQKQVAFLRANTMEYLFNQLASSENMVQSGSSTTNSSNTNNFNLTLSTKQSSHGVMNDFHTMKSLRNT